MQQQITQWWKSLNNTKRCNFADLYFPKVGTGNLTNAQIKHIYLMEHQESKHEKWWESLSYEESKEIEKKYGYYGHDIGTTLEDVETFYNFEYPNNDWIDLEHQEKSYTIEQAVEHLKNGGAIEIGAKEFDKQSKDKLRNIFSLAGCDVSDMLGTSMYYFIDENGKWMDNLMAKLPTIKLSQITYDNAVNGKTTAHELYVQSQNDGSDYETLLRENGLIISTKDVVDSAKRSGKNWEEDYSHENGNYSNICIRCKSEFYGHKRRVVCKECVKANEPSEARIIDEDASVLSIEDSFKSMKKEVFELDCENKALSAIKKGLETSNAELVKANSELVDKSIIEFAANRFIQSIFDSDWILTSEQQQLLMHKYTESIINEYL